MPLIAVIAVTLAATMPTVADLKQVQGDYQRCLSTNTVTLGQANAEPAETILRAVDSVCRPQEDKLRAIYDETPLPTGRREAFIRETWTIGQDAGVAALLQVRATRR